MLLDLYILINMKIGGNKKQNKRGFTLVELLIVIVVIAILAAISIVAYNGIQKRTRDAVRMNDVAAMKKAIQLYKIGPETSGLPPTVPNPGQSTWESSVDPNFLSRLNPYTGGKVFSAPAGSRYLYRTFNAGAYGCPASMGPFYAIWVIGMENQPAFTRDLGPCPASTLLAPGSGQDIPSNYLYIGV